MKLIFIQCILLLPFINPHQLNKEGDKPGCEYKWRIPFYGNPAPISGLQMRDLLFKNLTSDDRKRKIISSSEIIEKEGFRSIIHRHFVCLVKEVSDGKFNKPLPNLYVLKEHNTKEHQEKFFCRLKGSMCVVYHRKLFLVLFTHSLKILMEQVSANTANEA